ADKLSTARTITLTGAVTGSTSFDGSANVTIATTSGS
ncbi:Decoration protein, partial [Salmonella enterica subsp. enterica serovar Ohio]|nr:Decoration protein [Salmonella enterica subsp. enterica serovar Ohio]